MAQGIFIGMATFDIIYYTITLPQKNQKIMADSLVLSPGDPPATPPEHFVPSRTQQRFTPPWEPTPSPGSFGRNLKKWNVKVEDIAPSLSSPPPIASIVVDPSSGDRAVLSVPPQAGDTSPSQWNGPDGPLPDVLLADGHQIPRAVEIAKTLVGVPLVLDGGSWKPGFEKLLPLASYVICSDDFRPPSCKTEQDVFNFVLNHGPKSIAVTHGRFPISYLHRGRSGQVPPPEVDAEDTTGAGDVFHGAFCHYILTHNFIDSLRQAAIVASRFCGSRGTNPPQLKDTDQNYLAN